MNRFKSIIMKMQGKNKASLFELYNSHWYSERAAAYHQDEIEKKMFSYLGMYFWFSGGDRRNTEKLNLYVMIPKSAVTEEDYGDMLPCESFVLSALTPVLNGLADEYVNTDKNVREKAQFKSQSAGEVVLKRNGMLYDEKTKYFIFKMNFCVPLVNALSVNAKATMRAVNDILRHIDDTLKSLDREKLNSYVRCWEKQREIREFMKSHGLCAFVADGSILPRENGTSAPMKNAVPFSSPDDMRVEIPLSCGESISGMGIKCGVTVITGGGYSGKSTLLDAIEMGIYNHVPGDGREYCLTDETALKIYAEDGRPVHSMDMSPFFRYFPGENDVRDFTTLHASGSVSQAANIIEAVCGKSTLMLIDEDRSATNFMIRDANMRKIVTHEPIIPFTDRVRELYENKGVSTILVIGGSGEYLGYADCVILMDDYIAKNITEDVRRLGLPSRPEREAEADWSHSRRLIPRKTSQPFLYFRSVSSENAKKIIFDDISADITHLTALISENQLNSLIVIADALLTDSDADRGELIGVAEEASNRLYSSDIGEILLPYRYKIDGWFEAVRPLDVFCCINRFRGISLTGKR